MLLMRESGENVVKCPCNKELSVFSFTLIQLIHGIKVNKFLLLNFVYHFPLFEYTLFPENISLPHTVFVLIIYNWFPALSLPQCDIQLNCT